MSGPRIELTVLEDAEDLIVRRGTMPGQGGPLTVVFAGGGDQARSGDRVEFVNMMARLGRPTMFIADRNRTWYARGDLHTRVIDHIRREMDRLGCAEIDTLGNSMGAFGALAFAEALPVRHALAFVPRFSPDPELIPDRRIIKHTMSLRGSLPFRTAEPGYRAAGSAMVVHGVFGPDLRHARAYDICAEGDHWVVPVDSHEVGAHLRKDGLLWPVVSGALTGDKPAAQAALQKAGAKTGTDMRPDLDRMIETYTASLAAKSGQKTPGLVSGLKQKIRRGFSATSKV